MKSKTMIIFYSVFFLVYFLAFFYIYIRGFQGLEKFPQYRLSYSLGIILLAWSYPLSRLLDHSKLYFLHDITYWIGSFWFAVLLYAFLIVVICDLTRLVNLAFHFLPVSKTAPYLNLKFYLLTGSSIVIILLLIAGFINARSPRIKELNWTIEKNGGNYKTLKIALASDIHLGVLFGTSQIEKLTQKINDSKVDAVIFAGDIIDEVINPVIRKDIGAPLRNLKSKLGTFAITGNHEYIAGVSKAKHYIESLGIKLIQDSALFMDSSFYLVGREDKDINRFTASNRKSLSEIVKDIDTTKPCILLDHQPFNLQQAVDCGMDVQLSGHTHHGQFWPLNYITQKVYEVSMGYKKKENTHIYVSNGYGFWGPPIRLGNRPELVIITLQFKN